MVPRVSEENFSESNAVLDSPETTGFNITDKVMTADCNELIATRPAEARPVDEYANFLTHSLGFLLSVGASVVLMDLVSSNPNTINVVACGVYCATLVSLYAASMFSHMFHDLAWRRFFRTIDQVCIYMLIAGSFTPFAVTYLWHDWWPALLVAMWILAMLGALLVLRVRNLTPTGMLTYGLMGWFPVISVRTLMDVIPLNVAIWIIAGGFCYCVGTVFLSFDRRIRYFHALWHTLVIGGSACHYVAVLLVVA